MNEEKWKICDKDDTFQQRTYKRVTSYLPEMECAKQLVDLVKEVYKPGMNVLDVGCAAGHFYNGIKRIDEEIKYQGADATTAYIQFAQKHFKNNQNTVVELADIFNLPKIYAKQFDIVICCNVILHLPSIQILLKNLLTVTRR